MWDVCTFLQPLVDMLNWWVGAFYVPLNFLGYTTPNAASWFNPYLPCVVT